MLSSSVISVEDFAFDGCDSLSILHYSGTEEDRTKIQIGIYNDPINNATWHYLQAVQFCGEECYYCTECGKSMTSGGQDAKATVKFLNDDGSVISENTYYYGETVLIPADPVKPADQIYTYEFAGWDKEISAVCRDQVTYTATYTEILDLQLALQEAAQTGGTVKLTQDTQVVNLVLWNGATLDLNGYTLTVDYLSAFGTVVDGTIGGNALVVVNKGIHVAGDNSFMPIYDTAAGGYRFYKYELQNLGFKAAGSGTVKAGFRLTLANPAGYGVLSTTTDIALDTVSLISWTGSMGVTHYTFSDNTLRNYAALAAADMANKGAVTKAITLTLTGVDSLGANPTVNFQPTVATAPGMTAKAPEAKWTAQ